MSHFELISSVEVSDGISVKKYVSKKTGIRVYIADVASPITNLYLAVATEPNDNDGIPHTLEHLTFMGSEDYPCNGSLDLLAHRCHAGETNAFTETDHTLYTLQCAGPESCLQMLPIYLDHVLFPTLSKSGFMTEVHSITGAGDDTGTVYGEMQESENLEENRCIFEMMRNIYSDHPYSYKAGGVLKNIRENLSLERIRDYHSRFYRAENLAVIVAGQVDIEEIAKSLETIEKKVLERECAYPPFVKPWQSPVKPLEASKDIKITVPSLMEVTGIVGIGFLGPKVATEFKSVIACHVLMRCLCGGFISPIQQSFVENRDQYAKEVTYEINEHSTSLLLFLFKDVPVHKIDFINQRLFKLLEDLESGDGRINRARIRDACNEFVEERLNNFDDIPHEEIMSDIMGDFIYGESPEDFQKYLRINDIVTELRTENIYFWLNLLRKYFVDNHSVTVRASPSVAEMKRLFEEEADRLEQRREALGAEGLALAGRELDEAIAENDKMPPSEIISSIPTPTTDSIVYHPSNKVELSQLPSFVEVHDIKTNFVNVTAAFDTTRLPNRLRDYLKLFFEMIFESPVQTKDGTISKDDAITALEEETFSYQTSYGLEFPSAPDVGNYSNTGVFHMQVEVEKLEMAVEWMSRLLFDTVFTQYDLNRVAKKLARKPRLNGAINPGDIRKLRDFYFSVIKRSIWTQNYPKLVKKLNNVRSILLSSIKIYVVADLDEVRNLDKSLKPIIDRIEELRSKTDTSLNFDDNVNTVESDFTGEIIRDGRTESSSLTSISPGIKGFTDLDLPPLLVFLKYLSQQGGQMYKKIRRNSYGFSLIARPFDGTIAFNLFGATNIHEAFKAAKTIVEEQLEVNSVFETMLLESAKGSLIFEIIQRESTIGDLVIQTLFNSIEELPQTYNKELIEKIKDVSISDLRRVGSQYLKNIFHGSNSKIDLICHPDNIALVKMQFEEFGHKVIEHELSSKEAKRASTFINSCLKFASFASLATKGDPRGVFLGLPRLPISFSMAMSALCDPPITITNMIEPAQNSVCPQIKDKKEYPPLTNKKARTLAAIKMKDPEQQIDDQTTDAVAICSVPSPF